MGLEEVVHDILDKAKSESAAVIREGNEQASGIIKKAESDASAKDVRSLEDLARVKEADERKEMADAALLSKKALHNVKKELVQSAYEGLNEKISLMPEKDRRRILAHLLAKCRSEIAGIGTIYANKKDMPIVSSLVKSGKISVLPENIAGGIIAESADGKFRADNSFDRFVERVMETRTKELSKMLF